MGGSQEQTAAFLAASGAGRGRGWAGRGAGAGAGWWVGGEAVIPLLLKYIEEKQQAKQTGETGKSA